MVEELEHSALSEAEHIVISVRLGLRRLRPFRSQFCAAPETFLRAAQLMTEHATAHLVVVDPMTHRPVGVLSTLDIAAALSDR